jgi:hypothetical protein
MAKSKPQSRESSLMDLMRSHKSAAQTVEHSDTSEPEHVNTLVPGDARGGSNKAKSQDPNYSKLTAYVPRKLHAAMKSKAALEEREISDVIVELVKGYVGR